MKVGYIQFDVSHNVTENLALIERHLASISCDLVVLPELCTCGYLFEDKKALARCAQPVPNGDTVKQMQYLSAKYQCTIIFGTAESEADRIYNTAVVVSKGDYVGKYRKMHLSDFEKTLFDCGDTINIFQIDSVTIGIEICFDLWFPEIARQQIRQGASLLCALGNFGGETTCLIAQTRAIENQTPLILCNRIGHESIPALDADFLGKSTVIERDGTQKIVGTPGAECAQCCEIDPAFVRSNVICADFMQEINRHYEN